MSVYCELIDCHLYGDPAFVVLAAEVEALPEDYEVAEGKLVKYFGNARERKQAKH